MLKTNYIKALLNEALNRLEYNPEGACWRLADALGELADKYPNEQGTGVYTGLGYKINKKSAI